MNSPEDDDNDNADREEESSSLMRPPPPKRVRIAENPGQVVGLVEPISDQERLESWYSSSEFSASKDSVKELCRSYRQSRRYSDCLTQAYNAACGLADRQESSSSIAVATTKASADDSVESKETELPDEGLAQWMQDGSRGLEGYSSRLHAMRRQRHFQDTKHAVFLEQARQNLSQNKDDTMLAKQAEQSSRRARSFAFLLGQADAWAVKAEDDTKDEQEEKTCTPSSSEEFANENEQNWEKQKSDTPTQPVERNSS